MNVRDKVQTRLDRLETLLKAGEHLKSAEGVIAVLLAIGAVTKFWRAMNDNERDFVNSAKVAVEDGLEWM